MWGQSLEKGLVEKEIQMEMKREKTKLQKLGEIEKGKSMGMKGK